VQRRPTRADERARCKQINRPFGPKDKRCKMTTIITRLYSDLSAANAAKTTLLKIGQSEKTIQIITGDGPVAAMKAARIGSRSAAAYAKAMTGPQSLLVVQAPFNPIGTAFDAIAVLRRHPAMDVGLDNEDVYLREDASGLHSKSIMVGHPLLMSNPYRRLSHGHIFGNTPILHSKERTSAIRGGAFMSRFFWPMKLVSAPKERSSAIRGGFLVSSLFGLPVLKKSWASRDDLPTIIR